MSDDELLIRIDERVGEILKRLDNQDGYIVKLETRVTALENFRWFIAGIAGLLGFLAGMLDKIADLIKN